MASGSIKAVVYPRQAAQSTYGATYYTRYGNVISIQADLYFSSALSANSVIATGFPVPLNAANSYKINEGMLVSSSNSTKCYVDGSGTLRSAFATQTGYFGVQLTYICV